MYGLGLDGYDPDSQHDAAVAFRIRVVAQEQYIPLHQHRKGQLIMALGGAITCEVENAMLMVPPQYAVWIPGQTPHSNKATPGAQLCLLFIEPGALELPTRTCTLKISPWCESWCWRSRTGHRRNCLFPLPEGWLTSCLMNCPCNRRSISSCRYLRIRKFV